jgi:hypothetical protein
MFTLLLILGYLCDFDEQNVTKVMLCISQDDPQEISSLCSGFLPEQLDPVAVM